MELLEADFFCVCVLLKLSWYKLKLECYNFRMLTVVPIVTIKKIATDDTQKTMRRLKMFHYKKIN